MCFPKQLLDAKPFSEVYCMSCHLYLIDTVKQHGYPTLFVTISPFEYTFPKVCNTNIPHIKTNQDLTEINRAHESAISKI